MNKKLYIFLRPSVSGLGGSLIYTLNKINYLKKEGFDVFYFHANGHKGEFQIPTLLEYASFYDERLLLPAYYFADSEKKSVINKFKSFVNLNRYDNITIESETIVLATWGEAIAKEIHARHIVFLLGEKQFVFDDISNKFMLFKLKRRELVGISDSSIKNLFNGREEIPKEQSLSLNAYCHNTVADIKSPFNWNPDGAINIGCIGRLDKPYVKYSLDDIKSYIKNNKQYFFNLILIGGGVEYDKILSLFKEIPNMKLYYTGNIFPIPLKMLLKIDVFISTSGSSVITSKLGKLTIAYDVSDYKPIGIVGITTDSIIYRKENEPPIDLDVLLDDIIVKKKYKESIDEHFLEKLNDFSFDSHLAFIENTEGEIMYFDFYCQKINLRLLIKKILLYILGFDIFYSLRKSINNYK